MLERPLHDRLSTHFGEVVPADDGEVPVCLADVLGHGDRSAHGEVHVEGVGAAYHDVVDVSVEELVGGGACLEVCEVEGPVGQLG